MFLFLFGRKEKSIFFFIMKTKYKSYSKTNHTESEQDRGMFVCLSVMNTR